MTTQLDFLDLHDATLVRVTFDWAAAEVRVLVRITSLGPRLAEVVVAGASLVQCPRQQQWGPSVSVGTVTVRGLPSNRTRVEIEMQSGDVIVIEGDAVRLGSESA